MLTGDVAAQAPAHEHDGFAVSCDRLLDEMQSLQTPQTLRGILLIDAMRDGLALADINALPEAQRESLVGLLGVWERLGILVFQREVSLDVVDDFYSGTIHQSWRKLGRYVEDLRRDTGRDTRWEWFQWLAERMTERESSAPPSSGSSRAQKLAGLAAGRRRLQRTLRHEIAVHPVCDVSPAGPMCQ